MTVVQNRPSGEVDEPDGPWADATEPLGTDASGERLPSLRDRLVPPLPPLSAAWWSVFLAVTVLGGILRLWRLGRPDKFLFDETYYAKDAWSLANHGVELVYPDNSDPVIIGGKTTGIWNTDGSFVVHPPLGKWMIATGELLYGMNPVGWRLATAVCGTLAILLVGRIVRRVTRSDLLGVLASLLYAVDGLAIVEARTAILDSLLAFWLLLATAALLLDRDRTRGRLADAVTARPDARLGAGPKAGWRPWRIVAGACFGLACATKWNGVFLLAVFGVMIVVWDAGARRAIGTRRAPLAMLRRDAVPAFVSLVGAAVVTYAVSWSGWFATSTGYDRYSAQTIPASGLGKLFPTAVRSWWHYHYDILHFNTGLTSDHPYKSNPLTWLLMAKPVAFDYNGSLPGNGSGCATNCTEAVHALGTPALWWGGCAAVLVCVWLWLAGRDWRAGLAVTGILGTWAPWLYFQHRTVFSFYAIVCLPFLVMAVVVAIGTALERARARGGRWLPVASALCGVFVVLVVVDAGFIYPVLVDQRITYDAWRARMWFSAWIG